MYEWLNPPADWSGDAKFLTLATDAATDFWRETFYGFVRDNGHAFLKPVSGDFSLSATIEGNYETLYDQAGVFLRLDAGNWIKAGIEFTDGLMHFSVVVTRGVSDWSVIPLPDMSVSDPLDVRLTRHGDAVRVQYRVGGAAWRMARLCPFFTADAQAGVMACSPERGGFRASFRNVEIGPAIARTLHEDQPEDV
ncbi:MAG: DUF1349 domain-containing protein [Shinella sp.]|nr:DUF1349 domain-containing protein [Shinella sp.]